MTHHKIIIDSVNNTINHCLSDEIINERKKYWAIPYNIINNVNKYSWLNRYRKLVGSASDGCILK